jgi:HEPN domain-containing protein
MSVEQARLEDTQAWLRKAADDIRAGTLLLLHDPELAERILFFAQQSIEKAFKAFLTWHDEPFRKTDDLAELGGACASKAPELAAIVEKTVILTSFAVAHRYPTTEPLPSADEIAEALKLSRETVLAILRLLAPAVGQHQLPTLED